MRGINLEVWISNAPWVLEALQEYEPQGHHRRSSDQLKANITRDIRDSCIPMSLTRASAVGCL